MRPSAELATHIADLTRQLEHAERETFRRRMAPQLELETIMLRIELRIAKTIGE